MQSARLALLAAPLFLIDATAAHAQSAPDLADLVGARAAGGETQMEARGYRVTGSNTVRDQRFTFWWNDRRNACVSISTMDGRYASIQAVPPENCDQSARPGYARPTPLPQPVPGYGGSQPGYSDPNAMVLICYGAGTKPSVTNTPEYRWNRDKHKWDWSSSLQSTTKGFTSDVQVELYGDHGRIHLASTMIPPIHSGGDNNWWDLADLNVTRDTITATYRLNGMNKPRMTIDRRTGRITIKGMTDFSGQCDVGNWGRGERRF